MSIHIKKFEELTLYQLYELLKLRFDVFVIEQQCIYDELDNEDQQAIHMFFEEQGKITAYLRLYKTANDKASFGRVVVEPNHRKKGLGGQLVDAALQYTREQWPEVDEITIGAQEYLQKFYESYGFQQISTVYLDEGIPHMDMRLVL